MTGMNESYSQENALITAAMNSIIDSWNPTSDVGTNNDVTMLERSNGSFPENHVQTAPASLAAPVACAVERSESVVARAAVIGGCAETCVMHGCLDGVNGLGQDSECVTSVQIEDPLILHTDENSSITRQLGQPSSHALLNKETFDIENDSINALVQTAKTIAKEHENDCDCVAAPFVANEGSIASSDESGDDCQANFSFSSCSTEKLGNVQHHADMGTHKACELENHQLGDALDTRVDKLGSDSHSSSDESNHSYLLRNINSSHIIDIVPNQIRSNMLPSSPDDTTATLPTRATTVSAAEGVYSNSPPCLKAEGDACVSTPSAYICSSLPLISDPTSFPNSFSQELTNTPLEEYDQDCTRSEIIVTGKNGKSDLCSTTRLIANEGFIASSDKLGDECQTKFFSFGSKENLGNVQQHAGIGTRKACKLDSHQLGDASEARVDKLGSDAHSSSDDSNHNSLLRNIVQSHIVDIVLNQINSNMLPSGLENTTQYYDQDCTTTKGSITSSTPKKEDFAFSEIEDHLIVTSKKRKCNIYEDENVRKKLKVSSEESNTSFIPKEELYVGEIENTSDDMTSFDFSYEKGSSKKSQSDFDFSDEDTTSDTSASDIFAFCESDSSLQEPTSIYPLGDHEAELASSRNSVNEVSHNYKLSSGFEKLPLEISADAPAVLLSKHCVGGICSRENSHTLDFEFQNTQANQMEGLSHIDSVHVQDHASNVAGVSSQRNSSLIPDRGMHLCGPVKNCPHCVSLGSTILPGPVFHNGVRQPIAYKYRYLGNWIISTFQKPH